MAIVVQDPGIGEGLGSILGGLGQAYGRQQQRQRQEAGLQEFSDSLSSGDTTPASLTQAMAKAAASGADPNAIKATLDAYRTARENNAFNTALSSALNQTDDLTSPEGKALFAQEYAKAGGSKMDALKLFEDKKTPRGPQSAFQKKMDNFKADSIIEYLSGDTANNMKDNLDWLESNVEDVGLYNPKTWWDTVFDRTKITEFGRRGNLLLQGVIDIFNKAGVLPQRKLEWLKNEFAISPYDRQDVIQGKVNALRSIQKDVSKFREKLGDLLDKYGEDIPINEWVKLQREADRDTDQYYGKKAEDFIQKGVEEATPVNRQPTQAQQAAENVVETLPTKGVAKNQTATDESTGKKVYFDGKVWRYMDSRKKVKM